MEAAEAISQEQLASKERNHIGYTVKVVLIIVKVVNKVTLYFSIKPLEMILNV